MVPPHLQNRIETPWHRGRSQTCLWDLLQARVWVPDLLLEEKALDSLPSPGVPPPGMLFPLFPLGTSGSNGSASVSLSSLTCRRPSRDSELLAQAPGPHVTALWCTEERLICWSLNPAPQFSHHVTQARLQDLWELWLTYRPSVYWKRKNKSCRKDFSRCTSPLSPAAFQPPHPLPPKRGTMAGP